MRVGEPRVQRSQTHLGAVADQEEKERRLEPHDPEPGCARDQVGEDQAYGGAAVAGGGDREEEVAEQRERDPDGADQQVLPRRLERTVVPMEVDQRRARQRGGLHRHPEEPESLAHRDERHRGQEEQQAGREGRFGRVVEQEALLDVLPFSGPLLAQVGDAVQGGREEQRAGDGQEHSTEGVEREPAAPRRRGLDDPGRRRHARVGHRGEDQQRAARAGSPHEVRQHAGHGRNQEQARDHPAQSLSVRSRSASMWSNSRLMWNTAMPMTNTATNRSSSTPSSTTIGVPSTSPTPKA